MEIKRLADKIWGYWSRPHLNYQPLIEVRIFKDALAHNLDVYRKKYPALAFAPVLKSNAYGHGLAVVAKILDKENIPFFVVDSFYEALTLRQHGIKSKILILGYVSAEQIFQNVVKNTSIGITSLEQLKMVADNLKSPKSFHLKIDTGMNRQGVSLAEVPEAIGVIKANRNFILEGLCTHLAQAVEDSDLTKKQIANWQAASQIFKENFSSIKYWHVAASAGVLLEQKIFANVARLGWGLYGLDVWPQAGLNLRPALELRSVVGGVKKIAAGECVGYDGTFTAERPLIAATLPLGYNEGVDRRLSNKGWVKIRDSFCPIIGRVSMNITTVDASGVGGIKLNEAAIMISADAGDRNSAVNIAKLCDCLPLEILIHIPSYLRRKVV